jgi:hypothetical protein
VANAGNLAGLLARNRLIVNSLHHCPSKWKSWIQIRCVTIYNNNLENILISGFVAFGNKCSIRHLKTRVAGNIHALHRATGARHYAFCYSMVPKEVLLRRDWRPWAGEFGVVAEELKSIAVELTATDLVTILTTAPALWAVLGGGVAG